MKETTIAINCSLCDHSILSTKQTDKTIEEIAKQHELASILVRVRDEEVGGFLCNNCANLLLEADTLKKIVSVAKECGNSSHVILPRGWLGTKTITYKID